MDLETMLRLVLVYLHLLFCVFALREVLVADWQLLRHGLRAVQMHWLHRRILLLLLGLWLSGLAIVALDTGFDPGRLVQQPKALAKLATATLLTLNGALLRHWCFPRVERLPRLPLAERIGVLLAGATSTASWLVAAFFGIARPLREAPLATLLQAYGVVLLAAALVALALALLRWPRAVPAAGGIEAGSLSA